MHAFLAKPLDWLIIQLARRSVCRTPGLSAHAEKARALVQRTDFFGPFQSPPADLSFGSEEKFTFSSSVKTPFRENNRVHGRIYRSREDWQVRPAVILVHGWNAEWGYRVMFPRLAEHFARVGVNAAMIELPYHAQRKPRGAGGVRNFISEDLACMLEATQQAIADIHALAHWLKAGGSPRVGVWGFSLGAWLAGLAICTQPNLDAATLATPVANIEQVIAALPFCAPIRRSLGTDPFSLDPLSLLSHRPKPRRENILLLESKHDLFVSPETVEELWRRWQKPELWRLAHSHISIWLAPRLLKRAALWLAGRLNQNP